MKAAVYNKFGTTDELKLKEVPKPVPKDDEVLIRVVAASVNSWDYDLITGKPYIYRLLFGLFKPRYNIIGIDVAGVVEVAGKNIKKFSVGDEVFADVSPTGFGAFAEFVCTNEELLAHKSPKMSFEEAASLPHAGVLALQGLKQYGEIKPGQQIAMNGAGGGVGTLGLQIAKYWGAEVTCIDKGSKLDMLKALGADHVIDYTKEDFTGAGIKYDLIVDPVARRPVKHYSRALKPKGAFVLIGGSISTIFQTMTIGAIMSKKNGKRIGFLPHKPNGNDLDFLTTLFEDGLIKPVIDKTFSLDQASAAVQRLGDGKVKGKVIILI